MDKEKLKAYGVDYENAVKRFAGNEALYEKFLKKLTEDDHLAIGEQAMKEERYEDVLEAVHALKGVAGTLGMTELFQAASVVVASIRKNEISHLQEQMARYIQNLKKPVRRFPEQIDALPACVRKCAPGAHLCILFKITPGVWNLIRGAKRQNRHDLPGVSNRGWKGDKHSATHIL